MRQLRGLLHQLRNSIKKPQLYVEEVRVTTELWDIYQHTFSGRNSFLLDSSLIKKHLGVKSLMGREPFFRFRVNPKERERTYIQPESWGWVFNLLRELLEIVRTQEPAGHDVIPGAAVGYLSYDLGRLIEKLPYTARDDGIHPYIDLNLYDMILEIDHLSGRAFLSAVDFGIFDVKNRFKETISNIKKISKVCPQCENTGYVRAQRKRNSILPHNFIENYSNFTRDEYLKAVKKAIDYIYAGDIYQVNLSQRFQMLLNINSTVLYKRLREINPAPFAAFMDFGDIKLLSSSPERFLKVVGRNVETRPIKGTRPRGKDAESDTRLKNELKASEKDNAELAMIVDLERNDLGKVCVPGSVKVKEHAVIEEYATVHHLVSTVEGSLRQDVDLVDLIKASFPGGSITGAPKIRAMEIIEELEPTKRGLYTGSIGYIGFNGNMDLNIAIRTIIQRRKMLSYQVGGGIVADSVPEEEYQETLDKGIALARAIASV